MKKDARLDQHVINMRLRAMNRGGKTSIAKVGGESPGKDETSAPSTDTRESCVDQHGGRKAVTSHGKSTSVAVWHQQSAVFGVIKPRGDALRSMGSTLHGRMVLYAEEALWLAERGLLAVQRPQRPTPSPTSHLASAAASSATTTSLGVTPPSGLIESDMLEKGGTLNTSGISGLAGQVEEDGRLHGDSRPHQLPPMPLNDAKAATIHEAAGVEPASSITDSDITSSAERYDVPQTAEDCTNARDSRYRAVHPATARREDVENSPRGEDEHPGTTTSKETPGRGDARDEGNRQRSHVQTGVIESGVRCAVDESEPGFQYASIDWLRETLSRAGVPWECYRAYAELKRRFYVVRRQPEDSIQSRRQPHEAAPPLLWFGARKLQRDTASPTDFCGEQDEAIPVTFHAYAPPNSNFRKRDPGPPDFVVAVCRYADPMPAHRSLASLARRAMSCAYSSARKPAAAMLSTVGKGEGKLPGYEDLRGLEAGDTGVSGGDRVLSASPRPSIPLAAKEVESGGSKERIGEDVRHGTNSVDTGGVEDDGDVDRGKAGEPSRGGATAAMEAQGQDSRGIDRRSAVGVKLAVVTGEGGVHFFDVGVHGE